MAAQSPNPALDGESRVTEIIVILSVASVLSTLAVTLRCYSRGVILRSFGLDDAIMVPAQILTLASAVAIGLEAKYGLGRHAWTMPEENLIPYMKAFYSSIVVYNIAVCMTKISILLQYRRIFNNTALRKFIIFGLAFLTCWGITLSLLLPLVCIPVAAFWDPNVDGFCLNNAAIWYVMAGVNLVTDFTLYAMPIPVISSLQLPKKQKALLIVVFTLGIFPCAVSIYRIHTLAAAARSTDPTWDNVDAATLSFLELSVAVITVCLPTLRPVLIRGRIFASLLRSNMRSSTGPTGGRPSRATFGNARSGSSAEPSTFKSGLRPSDSTEGLRPEDSRSPRGRLDHHDIEFGELDGAGSGAAAGPRRYSVSVVAGCMPESGSVPEVGAEGPGIKTTTVVSQKVSFHGGERPSDSDEEQGIGEGKLQGI